MHGASKRRTAAEERDIDSHASLEERRAETEESLERLGQVRADVAGTELARFMELFTMLKNVKLEFDDSEQMLADQASPDLVELDQLCLVASNVLQGAAGGAAAGAFAGFAAYGAVGALASASTGTAISALSGAAATNATLAWLGGGSLAAGGWGMAGGAMVLGGVIAGPFLLVSGGVVYQRARKYLALTEAHEAQVAEAVATRALAESKLNTIVAAVEQLQIALSDLAERFDVVLDELQAAITRCGIDYATYDLDDRRTVHRAFLFAQACKLLIVAPFLGDDGELLDDSRNALAEVEFLLAQPAVV